MACSKKKHKKLGSAVRSESGSNVSRTIVLHKVEVVQTQRPFHFSVSSGTVSRDSECSLHYITVLFLFASSERAPAVEVLYALYIPECTTWLAVVG